MTNTALQVTNFDFYGDNLIALQDNATGEVYTAINSVLRGIGFTERQTKHIHKKWNEDIIISKGVQNFVLPDKNGINQDTLCISDRKLPIALTKISITPKMKQNQPELVSKLELYQDKCADVLASVFIDRKIPNNLNLQSLIDTLSSITQTLTTLTQTITTMQQEINDMKPQSNVKLKQLQKKKFSYWSTKMFPKYQLLTDYFNISNRELYKELFRKLQNTYPDIDLNQIIDDYCYENNLETCFTLDAIEHNKTIRTLYESVVNNLLEKYHLSENISLTKYTTIFDN